jgi:hypothetical protein
VAKPDEGRWDKTIPVGEVSDPFAKHHSIARLLGQFTRLYKEANLNEPNHFFGLFPFGYEGQ